MVAALAIAFCKASLMVLFFMHVRYSASRTKVIVMAGLLWLGVLLLLTMTDYVTRP